MSVDKDSLKIGELKTFVETCREQGIGDNKIVNMAVSLDKWDKNLIEAFVVNDGNDVGIDNNESTVNNTVPQKERVKSDSVGNKSRPQLSAIMMVIHHISLWVFLLTAVPLMIGLILLISSKNSDFFYNSGSFETLISFIVVLCVTGGLYGSLFFYYFKKLKYNPELQTGRIFSLINIAFSLITVIGSTITLIVTMVNYLLLGRDKSTVDYFAGVSASAENNFPTSTVLVTLSLIILYGSVFITYFASDFMKPTTVDKNGEQVIAPKRKVIMLTSTLTSFVLLAILLITSFAFMPSAIKDSKTVDSVSSAMRAIHDNVNEKGELLSLEEFNRLPGSENLTYKIVNDFEYDICAEFENDTSNNRYSYGYDDRIDDSSIYRTQQHEKGNHCFEFYNYELKTKYEDEELAKGYPDYSTVPGVDSNY